MSRNASFVRKVCYIAAIALLLIPLAALSQPATTSKSGDSPGGKLAQLRTEYNLAQAELGEIDPASETMKLATVGLRGVAVNILWSYANHYKKVEDWDALAATVQQIIRLQPNFLEVWDFQAHNLSYNVSVEFDDYRYRYHWVKEGIKFLITGTEYNRDEPGLLNQVGWFTGQKFGRSDEQKQFRRLFREDKDFHAIYRQHGVDVDLEEAIGPDNKPDNWLVARQWYNKATDAVTFSGRPIRGKSPLLFYSGGPMSQINGAAAMQKDGFFRQRAEIAWQRAANEWFSYGNRELPTSAGFNIRLNDYEATAQRREQNFAKLQSLAPGVEEEIRQEKIAALPDDVRRAWERPEAERTTEERGKAFEAERVIKVSVPEIAVRAPQAQRAEARDLAERIAEEDRRLDTIDRERRIVNFVYWRTRCESDSSPLAQGAHEDVYNADKLQAAGEQFDEAKMRYERAWDAWAQIFDKYPVLIDNAEAQDLIESVERYRDLLGQMEAEFPRDFKLKKLLEAHYSGRELLEQIKLLQSAARTAPSEEKPKEEKPGSSPDAEKKPDPAKADASKSDEKKPEPAKTDEKKSEEKQAEPKESAKPAEEKKVEAKPAAEKAEEKKPEPAKTDEKPAEPKADAQPADEKPADEKPADGKQADAKKD